MSHVARVAVVGRGVVGDRIVRRVQMLGHDAVAVGSRDRIAADVTILAHPGPHAALVSQLLAHRRAVVSVGDGLDDVRAMIALGEQAERMGVPLVVGAAMSPGLTGLLARMLADQLAVCDEIHVAFHGTAGPACARQHHRALAGRSINLHDGQWLRHRAGTGRELCWFPEPVGAYDCYRAEIASPLLLAPSFPGARRITARMSATRRDRLTSRLPMLTPPHDEGGVGAVRVEVRGATAEGWRETLIAGVAEMVGTATAATAVAFADAALAGALPTGIVAAGDPRLDTLSLLRTISRLGVRLQEFTGVATP